MGFKELHSFEDRCVESDKIMKKYPERIPIIVEKGACQLQEIGKNKFLVSREMTVSQFVFMIRKRIKLEPSQSLFVLMNQRVAAGSSPIGSLYDEYKDTDGFIYMVYTSENTFG
jgi:GABA(A) receptor-associated protein